MMPAREPFGWHALAHVWQFEPWWALALVVLGGGYLAAFAAGRRAGDGGRVPVLRAVSFVGGLGLTLLTLCSAIGAYAMTVFWVHMVEHLILIMVVPALLVLGHPLTVVRQSLSPLGRTRFDAVLRSWPIAVLTHPLSGFTVYAVVIFGTHLTSFMDQMAVHGWLMTGEQVVYVVSGWLLLLPLIGEEPIRWRPPYLPRVALLLFAMVPDTVVGIVLLQSEHVLFPVYMRNHPDWAPTPVRDTQIGGALMWVGGDGLMMLLAVGLVVVLITNKGAQQNVLGPWLESVRSKTLAAQVSRGAEEDAVRDAEADSAEMLEAYNRMLGRLHDRE